MAVQNKTLTLVIKFNDFSIGQNALLFSAEEFKNMYLPGIPLCNPLTGQTIGTRQLTAFIRTAQQYIESVFNIKLFKSYIKENKDFIAEEYKSWGFLRTTYLINKMFRLQGNLNERKVITYPREWLTIRRETGSGGYNFWRNLFLVPNGGSGASITFDYIATFNNQWIGMYGARTIPQYWGMEYLTGFDKVPDDLLNIVGKYAATQILPVIELQVAAGGGYVMGVASQSISIDGLSQSNSKANNGNIFKNRMDTYNQQLKDEMVQLKYVYSGITFEVC